MKPHILRGSARAALCLLTVLMASGAARASDQMYFPATTDTVSLIVSRINAETVRIDVSAWYLTEHAISQAIVARFQAGVAVRVIGDRGSIFEIDKSTKLEFYYLANYGVPIRLRYNPTWYPEIDHWKMAIFKGQGVVEFGSANWATYELKPASSTNYSDETVMFTDDPVLVGAFETKFDRMWNDTTTEPGSMISGPPYLKNWWDACSSESNCSDYSGYYPHPAPMSVNTARLEPNNYMPPDLIWGQGPDFNNRLTTEIDNEYNRVRFVIYRLTVDNITNALLAKKQAGVPIQVIIEPNEYLNRKWPEFWITHANVDKLWRAGIAVKQRAHQGLTHMKMLVTSAYATNASSNYAAAWQRDHDYFVSASDNPTIYSAMSNRFDIMWGDTSGFTNFVPQPADAPGLSSPGNTASGVSQKPTLTWNTAAFAVSYDVYLGTSQSSMSFVGNVPAQLVNNPPGTYSWTATTALQGGTTYYWKVVSRTYAADIQPSLLNPSTTWSFTTTGTPGPTPPPPSSLPSPWANVDIGSVGIAGSANYSSGVFSVNGAGSDIWGTSDSFQYVYQPLSGDGQIVARLTSQTNTGTYAKAGVMLRESLTASAANVLLDVNPTGGVEFMKRSSTAASTTWVTGGSQAYPAWVKLARSGSTVTGYVSSDGSTWRTIGSTTVSMATTAYIGLAVCSHTTSAIDTAAFDNVSVGGGSTPPPPSSLPSPWQNQDVGSVGVAGASSYSNGTFTVKGAGSDIWGTSDSFQYAYQPLSGDGQIVVRVLGETNTDAHAKAGVMLRETTASNARQVILDVNPNGNVEFMSRASTGGSTTWIAGASRAFPAWLRLARTGSTVTGSVSGDGSAWTTVGSTTVTMATGALVGMAVTSHDTGALNTATFDNVSVTAGGGTPPPSASNVVIYASDIASSSMHGIWSAASDSTSPNGIKLVTTDTGWAQADVPLASPANYVDVAFTADAGTAYTLWLRTRALNNSKYNDSLWVQFSDARVNGSPVYAINTTTGLLVNLATDSSGSSLNAWGWQNGAYWLSQPATITFAGSGSHTLRIQVREDGVQFDQIVLSPAAYLTSPPGPAGGDSTIVPR